MRSHEAFVPTHPGAFLITGNPDGPGLSQADDRSPCRAELVRPAV